MNILQIELQKERYSGLGASEALALLPEQVTKIGRIQDYNKLDLITLIITGDVEERMALAMLKTDEQLGMVENPDLANAYRGLAKIMGKALDVDLIKADIYRINLGLPEIRGMFDAALSFGLLTLAEHTLMLSLAEYKEGVDFSDYSLSDIEQALVEIATYSETAPLKVGYPQLDSSIDYTVVLTNKSVQFAAVLLAPALADTKINIYVHTDYSDTETFETVGLHVGYILIKKGDTSGSLRITKDLSRKIQVSAKSTVIGDYNLFVKAL